jgi:hypothetical protein
LGRQQLRRRIDDAERDRLDCPFEGNRPKLDGTGQRRCLAHQQPDNREGAPASRGVRRLHVPSRVGRPGPGRTLVRLRCRDGRTHRRRPNLPASPAPARRNVGGLQLPRPRARRARVGGSGPAAPGAARMDMRTRSSSHPGLVFREETSQKTGAPRSKSEDPLVG